MNPDRHIYLATAVLAVVFAAAINVLAPRDPFAGTIVHREAGMTSSAQGTASPPAMEVAAGAAAVQRRGGTSL